jgi:hypothetical protein
MGRWCHRQHFNPEQKGARKMAGKHETGQTTHVTFSDVVLTWFLAVLRCVSEHLQLGSGVAVKRIDAAGIKLCTGKSLTRTRQAGIAFGVARRFQWLRRVLFSLGCDTLAESTDMTMPPKCVTDGAAIRAVVRDVQDADGRFILREMDAYEENGQPASLGRCPLNASNIGTVAYRTFLANVARACTALSSDDDGNPIAVALPLEARASVAYKRTNHVLKRNRPQPCQLAMATAMVLDAIATLEAVSDTDTDNQGENQSA